MSTPKTSVRTPTTATLSIGSSARVADDDGSGLSSRTRTDTGTASNSGTGMGLGALGGRQLRGQLVPPHMRYVEGRFRNARGQKLFYMALLPRVVPLRAVVLFMHAIGDHSRRYAYLYEHLCDCGFGVLAYDLVGHGASDAADSHATRAHSPKFRYFVDDTNSFLTFAKQEVLPAMLLDREKDGARWRRRYETPPIVLSGLSYGTLVGIHTALSRKHEFAALCLAGPSLNVNMTPVLRVQAVFARPMALLLPRARLVPGVNRDWLCRDPGFFEDFENDPLTNSEMLTMRMGEQTLRAMVKLEKWSKVEPGISFDVPLLFIVGSQDRVTSVPHAKQFFDRIKAKDKEFKLFEGLYHCVFEDPERDDVMRYMTNWLSRRFPPLRQDDHDEAEPEAELVMEEQDESPLVGWERSQAVRRRIDPVQYGA